MTETKRYVDELKQVHLEAVPKLRNAHGVEGSGLALRQWFLIY